MDLLVIQLKASIRRILETKGVRARVLDKVNRYGEVVIGVILERPAPAPRPVASAAGAESAAGDEPAPAAGGERGEGGEGGERGEGVERRDGEGIAT